MYTTQNLAEFQSLDLSKVIEIINPQRTPFLSFLMSTGKTSKAMASVLNWYEETLNTTAIVTLKEGGDAPTDVQDTTALLTNFTEILSGKAVVSATAQASSIVGVDDLMVREINKKLTLLKYEIENRLIKGTKAAATATVGQKTNGILNLINASNVVTGAFSQSAWENTLKKLYDSGTNDSMICFLDDTAKKNINSIIAPQYFAKDNFLGFTCDRYHSEYGDVSFVLCPALSGTNTLFVVNPEYLELSELQPAHVEELGKTGNSISKSVVWEGALKLLNSKAGAKWVMS